MVFKASRLVYNQITFLNVLLESFLFLILFKDLIISTSLTYLIFLNFIRTEIIHRTVLLIAATSIALPIPLYNYHSFIVLILLIIILVEYRQLIQCANNILAFLLQILINMLIFLEIEIELTITIKR